MLFILAIMIGLTVWAWRRGWRWWALLPIGSEIGLAFILAFIVVASTGAYTNPDWIDVIGPLMDISVIIALVVMIIKKRAPKITPKSTSEPTPGSTPDPS